MPKKKPIAKRLNKLFDDIPQEEPKVDASPRPPKSLPAPTEQAQPVAEVKRVAAQIPRSREVKQSPLPATETAIVQPFDIGQNNWAVLHVADDLPDRQWTDDEKLLVEQ